MMMMKESGCFPFFPHTHTHIPRQLSVAR